MTIGVLGLLALTLFRREFNMDMDFSLRQTRTAPDSAQEQTAAARRPVPAVAAPLCGQAP